MAAQLRLYAGPDDADFEDGQDATVRIRLADLLPLLALAKKNNYL